MSMRIPVSIVFAVHVVIGNFCVMPMAFAEDTAMPYAVHMEMVMTPMFPMSPANCDHCVQVQLNDGDQSRQQTGCAGHCFSQSQNAAASAVTFDAPHIGTANPIPIISAASQTASVAVPPATAPPTAIHTDTIVLRL
ncbi:MAG: hypothetical protein Greene041619_453 [Candidatus Peregrinibacteria bacterium Greene0416_19]|nr:MAG: hypothetical protein Greene041619_453 [Candidatus Peregrinibacteria bacterium Greene0416_19]